jgi:tetratricopeptide (TPR) repeat protein
LDAEGKSEEALAKYQELVKGNTGGGNVEIKLNMARLYGKLKKPDQSLAVYESLKGLPNSALWEAEIEERTRQLLIEHPELAKTAAAIPTTTTNATTPVKAKP